MIQIPKQQEDKRIAFSTLSILKDKNKNGYSVDDNLKRRLMQLEK